MHPSWSAEQVADRLVEHSSVVADGLLPPDLVSALSVEARALRTDGRYRAAGIGRGSTFQLRPEIRADHVLWLDPDHPTPAQAAYLACMEELRAAVNQRTFIGLFRFEGHLAVYPPGAAYHPHLDRFKSAQHRWVTCILYLNDGWTSEDGGQLRLHLPDGPKDVLPLGGRLVIFFSGDLLHEVIPARRERYSLTGWLCQRD